ncbi:MAG: PAS domain S-box protein, partial [Pseudomonadota bacterium]
MKKADFQTNSLASLRDSALQVLSQQQAQRPGGNRLEADVRKQLHELQVNQIELEMQNSALAEMNQSMGEVEAGLARYTDLYDFAPMGYCTVDRAGMLQDVNLTAAALLGLSRQKLVGLDLESFVVTTYKTVYTSFMADVFDGATGQFCEVVLKNKDRRAMFVRIEANTNPTSQTCRVILKDISARKSAENALREANDALERRVKERTAEVESANHFLRYQIEEHKRTVESLRFSREALRKLAAHQELIKEEERKRIAREIHDELGGLLTSIKANASVAISRKGR